MKQHTIFAFYLQKMGTFYYKRVIVYLTIKKLTNKGSCDNSMLFLHHFSQNIVAARIIITIFLVLRSIH